MSAAIHRFQVTLVFDSAVLSHVAGAIPFGLDAAMLQEEGKPALPGSLIRGNLRHAWNQVVEKGFSSRLSKEMVTVLLGNPPDLGTGGDRKAGLLRFDDLWRSATAAEATTPRYRIRLDLETGAVKRGQIQSYQPVIPAAGQNPTFSGWIRCDRLPDGVNAETLRRWLTRGLQLAGGLGAQKGTGLGRLKEVTVQYAPEELAKPDLTASPPSGFDDMNQAALFSLSLRLTPDRPFCFPRIQAGDNLFISHDHIPGGAIKGALAKLLERHYGERKNKKWPDVMETHFDAMRITHARAVKTGVDTRPRAIPLSRAWIDDRFKDLWRMKEPGLVEGKVPLFQIDWKDKTWRQAIDEYGWVKPERTLRVRNRIDPRSGATPGEDGLYTVESVKPGDHQWLANIDFPILTPEEQRQAVSLLTQLLAEDYPFCHLGRTKARARVELTKDQWPYHGQLPSTAVNNATRTVVIVLQSHARLLDIAEVAESPSKLLDHYRKTWNRLGGKGLLQLSHFFARQELFGGDWWWRHYVGEGERDYQPELFTTPGSTFVFTIPPGADHATLQTLLKRWQREGVTDTENARGGDCWKRNPWLPQNGYGEVHITVLDEEIEGGAS